MNMNNLMKQAQQMQAKLAMLQNELAEREVEASAGGGMVKVKVNGKQQVLSSTIDKECDVPNVVATREELVLMSVNSGLKELQDMFQQAMSKVSGGMNIPGLF